MPTLDEIMPLTPAVPEEGVAPGATPPDPFMQALNAYSDVSAQNPEKTDRSLWSYLQYLDTPGNASRDMLYRISSGDGDWIGGAIRGGRHDEHVSGVDLINSMARHFDTSAHKAWQLKQAQMGFDTSEAARRLMQLPEEEAEKISNPYGTIGKILGFGVELVTDPLNYLGGLLGKAAGRAAEAAKGTALERKIATGVISADIDTIDDMVRGARSPLAKRVFPVPVNVEAAFDEKAARAAGQSDEIDSIVDRFQSMAKGRGMAPEIRYAKQGLRKARKAMVAGEEGADELFARASEKVDALKAAQTSLLMAGKDMTPRELLIGAVATRPPSELAAAYDELESMRAGLLQDGPIQQAMRRYGNPAVGIGQLSTSARRAAGITEDLLTYMQPELGRAILLPEQKSFLGAVVTARARRVVDELGLESAARNVGEAGAVLNPHMMKELERYASNIGLPPEIAHLAGPEIIAGLDEVRQVIDVLNDDRRIHNAEFIMHAGDLVQYTQEELGLTALASTMLKQYSQKLFVNEKGLRLAETEYRLSKTPVTRGLLSDVKINRRAQAGFLAAEDVEEIAAVRKMLSDALTNHTIKSREAIQTVMDGLFSYQAAIKPDSALGQVVSRIPLANRLTEMRPPTPAFGWFGLRDPERVFRGTGVFERLYSANQSFTQSEAYYQRIRQGITKSLTPAERQALGKAMLEAREAGKPLSEETLAALGPKSADAYRQTRDMLHELADLQGMPFDERVSEYFTRVVDRDGKMREALANGHVPPELTRDTPVLGELIRRSDVAREWRSRFLKRAGDPKGEYVTDLDDVLRVYIRTSLKAHYLSPAFKEAGTMLLGNEIKTGGLTASGERIGSRATPGIAGVRSVTDPAAMKQIQYLKNLENVVHGVPTDVTEFLGGHVANVARTIGWEAADSPEKAINMATQVSGYLMRNIYRSTIGGIVPTPFQNLTQSILTAGEYGPLNALKGIARTLSREDPMEYILGQSTTSGAKALKDAATERLLQNYGDMYELSQYGGSPRDKAKYVLHQMVKGYDKMMFGLMSGTERFNRGVAFQVGMTYAKRMNLSLYDSLRLAHQVSDETQFIYGMMGRAPLFHDPFLRPMIAPFTSYPQKMAGTLTRMLRENPTSLMRLMVFGGGLSAAMTRMGVDPANLVNFAYMPSRFLLLSPMTPVARGLQSMFQFANSDPGTRQHDEAKVGVVEAAMFGGLIGLPMGMVRHFWKEYHIWHDDEIHASKDFIRVGLAEMHIPGAGAMFGGDEPTILVRPDQDEFAKRLAGATARMFGFHSDEEKIANQVMDRIQEMRNEAAVLRKDMTRIYRDHGDFADLSPDEQAKVEEYAASYGKQGIRDIILSVNNSFKTVLEKSVDSMGALREAKIRSAIAGLPDPKHRDAAYSLERQRAAMQRYHDEVMGSRPSFDNYQPETPVE